MTEGVLRATQVDEHVKPEWGEAKRPIRALLIQPPATGCVRSLLIQNEDDGEGDSIGFKPPLGLLYVASTVEARSDHEVKLIDAIGRQMTFEEVVAEAVAFQPDVVGMSAWTDWWYPAHRMGQLIKEALPEVHMTYGGPHLGIYPNETLDVPFIDSVIVGDGELPFLYLCNMVANGVTDPDLPGLHFAEHGVKSKDTFFIQEDLDALPIPNRQLLDRTLYGSVLSKTDLVTTMITSRGCPYNCTFCKLNFQKTLSRSATSVLEEFRQIAALGIKEVEIYDDTFTWSKKRLREICEGLIEADLGVEWAVRDRVGNAQADLLELMYRAGCRRIHYGVESGVNRILDRMRKRINTRQARRAVELAKDAGLIVLTYFMFGNLDETPEDMEETIKLALQLDADYCEFSITIPYAGTEMYTQALEEGVIDEDYWLTYAQNPEPNMLPRVVEKYASLEVLTEVRNEAVRRFYFRPSYLWREARRVRSFNELLRKGRMGGRLIQSVYSK
jgi:anaerobic magnesium-protoporphyrin IX monomethyl ester cyclase